jgi:4-amino-4-deoxy-L-arabinose transferase-like glycosyltransferase
VDAALAAFATPRARRLVLAAAAVLVLLRLGAVDLWPPDEPRYALVAEEMRSWENGWRGLVLLHLHGDPYTQKPPLFYWLAAAAGAPLGRVTETAARLPSALAGIATVAVVMAFGTRLGGRVAGTLAGLLLVTTIDWSYRARTVQLDTLLALFETAALFFFWRTETETNAGARRRNVLAMHAMLGLAVLSKGPVGFLIPLLAIAAYLGWQRRLRELAALLPPLGLALSFGPALVWLAGSVALAPAGHFRVAVIENLFGRLAGGEAAHARPFYYYLEKFPPDLLPWLLLLPVAIGVGRRALAATAPDGERRAWRFLVAWIATSFLFFSITSGKRLRYLLPIEPAFALLFALTLTSWLGARSPAAGRRLAGIAALVWVGQLVAYAFVLPRFDAARSPRAVATAIDEMAAPDARVGLYFAADIANAVAYYGERRVHAFRSDAQLAAFAADGGRVLVFEAERLPQVEAVVPVAVERRVTVGDDTWLVASVGAPTE